MSEWTPPHDQYLAVLDERDQAIERAEVAEAKLADYRAWWKTCALLLVIGVEAALTIGLFALVIYALSFVVPV